MKEIDEADYLLGQATLKFGCDDDIDCSIDKILAAEKFSFLVAISVINGLCVKNDGADINMVCSIILGFIDYLEFEEEAIFLLKKLVRLSLVSSRGYTYDDGEETVVFYVKRKAIGEYAVNYLTKLGPKMEEFLSGIVTVNVDEARLKAKEKKKINRGRIDMKKITDFLKTETTKEDLHIALKVLREFKDCESEIEWLNISMMTWIKLEQFEEFLEYLVNGKDLEKSTVSYMNSNNPADDCIGEKLHKITKSIVGEEGFNALEKQRREINESLKNKRKN